MRHISWSAAAPIALPVAMVAILGGCAGSHSTGSLAQSGYSSSPAASGTTDPKPTGTDPKPTGTDPKPTGTAAKPSPSPSNPCRNKLAAWTNGKGYQDFSGVGNALSLVGAYANSGNVSTAEAYAEQVWLPEAEGAAKNPIPACVDPAGEYKIVTASWESAAQLTYNGDFTGASPYLDKANAAEKKLLAEINKVEKN